MRKSEAFLRTALAASLVLATASVGAAAGMGGMGGGSMGGSPMGGAMTMGGYSSSGAMMGGQSGTYNTDAQDDRPGMGNIAISGRHIVQLSPARQQLPRIDRSLVGTLVPIPEMPEK